MKAQKNAMVELAKILQYRSICNNNIDFCRLGHAEPSLNEVYIQLKMEFFCFLFSYLCCPMGKLEFFLKQFGNKRSHYQQRHFIWAYSLYKLLMVSSPEQELICGLAPSLFPTAPSQSSRPTVSDRGWLLVWRLSWIYHSGSQCRSEASTFARWGLQCIREMVSIRRWNSLVEWGETLGTESLHCSAKK